jgi:hypothetical protein
LHGLDILRNSWQCQMADGRSMTTSTPKNSEIRTFIASLGATCRL